jgi:hypothetical protein
MITKCTTGEDVFQAATRKWGPNARVKVVGSGDRLGSEALKRKERQLESEGKDILGYVYPRQDEYFIAYQD